MSDYPAFTGNYITAKAGVFWDIEQCEIPEEFSASLIVQRIRESLTQLGHRGLVTINAYGDKEDHDFDSTGVKFNQFTYGAKYERHTKMMEDIVSFASENPEPSILMLVCGDTSDDFVELVMLLRDRKNYKVLCVLPRPPPRPTVTVMMVTPTVVDSDSDD